MSHRTLEKLLVVSICVALFPAVVSPASADLIRHWELDDGSGTNASDATTNADGTLTNFPVSPGWTTGQINGALTFDGTNDYIAAGSNALGSAYTITAWFKGDSFQPNDDRILFSQYNFVDHGRTMFEVRTNSSNVAKLALFEGSGAGHVYGTTTLSAGTWYFGAITRSGVGSGNLYLNGGLETTFSFRQTPPNVANYIGGAGVFGFGYFLGTIDDVRVYNTALSSQQIQALYVAVVPEPNSMILAVMGMSGFTALRRRSGRSNRG